MGFQKKVIASLVRTSLFAALVLATVAGRASADNLAPEIDPGSMGSALALLAGGFSLLMGRRSK